MSYPRCPVCLGPMAKGKKTCSPRCRLLKWAVEALLKARREGGAGGLREKIRELAEVER